MTRTDAGLWGTRRAAAGLAVLLALPGSGAVAIAKPAALDDPARIIHALNRLAYGPRPGDVERIQKIGLDKWIDQQLHPERIDDRALASRLAGLRTLSLDSSELLSRYDLPREAKRDVQKKLAEMDGDPTDEQKKELRRELTRKYRGQLDGAPRQVVEELQAAKLVRAVYSERQLDEVLTDFWLNHFNVFAGKGPVKFLVGEYERDVIRPRAWGKFEDLLRATAESPAMLFYLDNWLSTGPLGGSGGQSPEGAGSPPARRAGSTPARIARRRGLNENYAREIMELHTLGVDGGYTQKDVTEVARCFTGWTIARLRQGQPEFTFEPRIHDRGDKVVLGRRIRGGGQDEGREVIHLLATHPSTARFISTKLARRFVADEPPAAIVDRAAETFRRTGGDIREVVRAIVTAPEFFSASVQSVKVKTPLEFVASALRASGADVTDARDLGRRMAGMGMPLYLQQPPTGYKDTADAWVSTSGTLARLNLALDLAGGRVRGVTLADASEATATRLGSPEFQRR
jgi:uncharacterized protein (DUF1800 family)